MQIFNELYSAVEPFQLAFPEKINLIVTSGKEEGYAAYTRNNSIIIPKLMLSDFEKLKQVIAHEMFHIITTHNPAIKQRLYNAIGFYHVGEIEFQASLSSKKITNPDVPINEYSIRVGYRNRLLWVVPILFSSSEQYMPERGGEFFDYLQFRFLVVGTANQAGVNAYNSMSPIILGVSDLQGFFEKVGYNTNYIIHPEEILAGNFALLVLGGQHIKSREVINKIKGTLSHK